MRWGRLGSGRRTGVLGGVEAEETQDRERSFGDDDGE